MYSTYQLSRSVQWEHIFVSLQFFAISSFNRFFHFVFFPFFYGRLKRIKEINTSQLLEPCRLPRHRLFYPRNKKFVSIRDIVIFDISTRSSRHRDSRSFPYFNNNSITNHSESIYNIFVLYFAQTFVGGCVCASVFILLSSFIIYWEPSVTYVRESLTITYHTRRVVPRKWSTRNIVVFFFFSFFFLFY